MLTIKKPCAARLVMTVCATAGLLAFSGCSEPGPRALLDGEQMINERRFESAIDRLKLAVHYLPQNAQAQNHLGLAHHGARQLTDAAKAYRAALQLDDNLAPARFNLGSLLLESGDAIGAMRELGSFVVLRPNSIEGRIRLGSAQIRADRWEEAGATFFEAYKLNDKNPEILNALGLLRLRQGEREEAKMAFDKAVEQNPDYIPAKLNLAIYEHRHGNNKRQALVNYQRFLTQFPDTPHSAAIAKLAGALDRELNPRPAAAPTIAAAPTSRPAQTPEKPASAAAGPEGLVLAQMTERANASTPAETSAPRATTAQRAPENMTFQPKTELAAAPTTTTEISTEAQAESSEAPLRPIQSEVKRPEMKPAPPAFPPALAKSDPVAIRPSEKAEELVKTPEPIAEPVKPSAPATVPTVAETAKPPAAAPERPEVVKTQPVATPTATKPAPKPVVITAVRRPVGEPATAPLIAEPTTSIDPARTYRPENRPRPETEEKGFFKRLNPKRFFKSKEEVKTTPLPGSLAGNRTTPTPDAAARPAPQPTPPPRVAAPKPAPQRVQAPPARPEPPRYAYARPGPARSGDRQAASKVFLEGLNAHRNKRLSEAIKAYKNATLMDGSHYDAQYNLGLASYQANDLAESLRAYENALAIKPGSISARYNFAAALEKARYTRDAANELEKLLVSNPGQASAHLAAGNLYAIELGEPARARAHYLNVLKLDPGHRQAQSIRYWLSENQ